MPHFAPRATVHPHRSGGRATAAVLVRLLAVAVLGAPLQLGAQTAPAGDSARKPPADSGAAPRRARPWLSLSVGLATTTTAESRGSGPGRTVGAVRLAVPVARYLLVEPGIMLESLDPTLVNRTLVPEAQVQLPFLLATGIRGYLGVGAARFHGPSGSRDFLGGTLAYSGAVGTRLTLARDLRAQFEGRLYARGLAAAEVHWSAGLAWRL